MGTVNYAEYNAAKDKRCPDCGVRIKYSSTYCRKHSQTGSRSTRWKGGRSTNTQGYVVLSDMRGHPNADSDGRVLEHHFVMSQHLGRAIAPDETVHHKNGIRSDNRLENLEIWTGRHPSGGRVSDKIRYALWVIETYGDDPSRFE
jgi:hypothetical protein